MRFAAPLLVASTCLLWSVAVTTACTGEDPDTTSSSSGASSGASSSGASSGTSGASSSGAGSGPPAAPASVRFFDDDMTLAKVHGTLVVGKAADEANVKEYVLFWGTDATTRTAEIRRVAKVGNDVSITFEETVPANATHLLVAAANANGDLSSLLALERIDNVATHVNGYAGNAADHAMVQAGQKVIMAATLTDTLQQKAALLLRCDLDGSKCENAGIPSASVNNGERPALILDPINSKLLLLTAKHNAWTCPLDATSTSCTHFQTTPSQTPVGTSLAPSPAIDKANQKLFFTAWDLDATSDNIGALVLYRCLLTGSPCTKHVIAADGSDASLVLDETSLPKRVLAAYTKNDKPTLARCNLLDFAAAVEMCGDVDISSNETVVQGSTQILVDGKNQKLLVVAESQALGKPFLFRCALDGTACTTHDVSAGQGQGSGRGARGVIDAAQDKLIVVAKNESNGNKLSAYRCNLDGTECRHADISAGQTLGAVKALAPVVAGERLLVAAGPQFSLYTATLRGN
jgi:hypothetical protein